MPPSDEPKRIFRLEKDANKLSLVLPGRVEWGNIHGLQGALDRAKRDGHHFVVLDFSRTSYVDSVSIGTIVRYQKEFLAGNGSLVLYKVPAGIMKLFKLTMLADQFPIFDDMLEAEAFIRQGKARTG